MANNINKLQSDSVLKQVPAGIHESHIHKGNGDMGVERKITVFMFLLLIFMSAGIAQPLSGEYTVEKIADGFQFLEGPVWKDGGLLFSDIPANIVYRWHPDSGVTVYLSPSGNSNGLALHLGGQLLLAQHGNRRVALLDNEGVEKALVTHYDGKRLNSPNDMAVKSDGAIFFTDPPYGISSGQEELGFYGIYRLSPTGDLYLLDASLHRPNGIAFSPDEKFLYVSDTEERKVFIWDVVDDSLIANKRQFAFMNASGGADGMKVDREGNLFATGPLGVWVYAPDGSTLDTIQVPGQTTNCNWGDDDGNTLYVTSGPALFRVRKTGTSVLPGGQGRNLNRTFKLYPNYPNPFNGTTHIHFDLYQPGNVKIDILNDIGETLDTIADSYFGFGSYRINWDAGDLSSGIFFAHLRTSNGSAKTKCLLIK